MLRKTIKILLWTIVSVALITYLFVQQPSFGKLPAGERLARIEKSTQYKDGIFLNRVETELLAKDATYYSMFTKFFGSGIDREPTKELPCIKTDLRSLPDSASLVWFGHSSFLITVGDKKILSDPVFSERASPVQYFGPKAYPGTMIYDAEDFPDLDVVVISHDHYDHLDYNTILKLKDKTKFFVVPLGVGEHLAHWGVAASKIKELDWWQSETVLPGLELTATPARHFSGRGFQRNKTLWASFVLKTGGYSIFIGGDSGYDDTFQQIGQQFGPFDMAMLECGQYDPQWPDIHMAPEETAQAAVDLRAKVFLPVHWGKFTLALHPWKDPIQRVLKEAEKLNATAATPKIGEPLYFGQDNYSRVNWWEGF